MELHFQIFILTCSHVRYNVLCMEMVFQEKHPVLRVYKKFIH